jgi:hypothetical protein
MNEFDRVPLFCLLNCGSTRLLACGLSRDLRKHYAIDLRRLVFGFTQNTYEVLLPSAAASMPDSPFSLQLEGRPSLWLSNRLEK